MISDLATGAGTLVLAVATFASVRSANATARIARESLAAGLRPVLMNSRFQDPRQKIRFTDGQWVAVPGGCAVAEATDRAVYLVISVRNAGTGMAIIHGWRLATEVEMPPRRPDLSQFTAQTRDEYVGAGDAGFWQGALRDPDAELFKATAKAIAAGDPLTIDVLYGDFEGGQRVITRFSVVASPFAAHEEDGPAPALAPSADLGGERLIGSQRRWLVSVGRHWNVDRPDPR
jgi:hypothetical protein